MVDVDVDLAFHLELNPELNPVETEKIIMHKGRKIRRYRTSKGILI